jgi:hypothetical protein
MAGDATTSRRADFFDCLSEEGSICLTAITRLSWHEHVNEVDRIFFHLADRRDRALTCQVFGIELDYLDELVRRSGEDDLAAVS